MKMKILIISDLHLGLKDNPSNSFKLNEYAFNKYLLDGINEYDNIIMNGDVFELWESLLETSGATLELKFKNQVNEILNSWIFGNLIRTNPKIIIINGNHDLYIKNNNVLPKRIADKLIISHNHYNILITHGHKGDLFCDDKSICRYITCCCSQTKSKIEDLLDENLDKNIDQIVKCIETKESKITDYALKILDASNFNVVIFGHTHTQTIVKKNGKVYINEGCLVGKDNSIDQCILYLDGKNLVVDNINVNLSNPKQINKRNKVIFLDGKLQ
jgi:predicted phosphodiesterase